VRLPRPPAHRGSRSLTRSLCARAPCCVFSRAATCALRSESSEEEEEAEPSEDDDDAPPRRRTGARTGGRAARGGGDAKTFASFAFDGGAEGDNAAAGDAVRARPRRAAAAAAAARGFRGGRDVSSAEEEEDDDDDEEEDSDGGGSDGDEDGAAADDGDGGVAMALTGTADDYAAVRDRPRRITRSLAALALSCPSLCAPHARPHACSLMFSRLLLVSRCQAAAIERVLGVQRLPGGGIEYCVKLKGRSYREAMWRSGMWMDAFAATKLRGFRGRAARDGLDDGSAAVGAAIEAAAAAAAAAAAEAGGEPSTSAAPAAALPAPSAYIGADVFFPAAFCAIDRIIGTRPSEEDGVDAPEYLVKWRGLGYASSTWEASSALSSPADAAAVARFGAISAPSRAAAHEVKLPAGDGLVPPPPFAAGCALRDYQCVSFDWMVRNQRRRRNVILGDEMGLGKTAQSVAVLEHARREGKGPFLVIAPLTTLTHWQREIQKWCVTSRPCM
jgi:hypothetical protein